jgi:hypothetical protein
MRRLQLFFKGFKVDARFVTLFGGGLKLDEKG